MTRAARTILCDDADTVETAVNPGLPLDVNCSRIAIVDDESINVRIIRHRLEKLGYRFLLGITDSTVALEALEDFRPDVVLMDVVMPGVSGIELLAHMREHPALKSTPAIVLTAAQDRATRLAILELGVADFLAKPIDAGELSTRLRNVIEAKRYRDHLTESAKQLELAVKQRTQELEISRREVISCLARAAEYRDDNTGRHVVRVGRYSAILADAIGLPAATVDDIELAAQLHDVGKIGIPDAILHKPAKLTHEEMELMRRHADYGWRILAPLAFGEADPAIPALHPVAEVKQSPLLVMAARISASHHERWNGDGYPQGLSGEAIPLEARITAVADVFDALSTPRCYKAAMPLDECFAIIAAERGAHFDPRIVDACLDRQQQFRATYAQFMDRD